MPDTDDDDDTTSQRQPETKTQPQSEAPSTKRCQRQGKVLWSSGLVVGLRQCGEENACGWARFVSQSLVCCVPIVLVRQTLMANSLTRLKVERWHLEVAVAKDTKRGACAGYIVRIKYAA